MGMGKRHRIDRHSNNLDHANSFLLLLLWFRPILPAPAERFRTIHVAFDTVKLDGSRAANMMYRVRSSPVRLKSNGGPFEFVCLRIDRA